VKATQSRAKLQMVVRVLKRMLLCGSIVSSA